MRARKAGVKPRRRPSWLRRLSVWGGLLGLLVLAAYLSYLDWRVRSRFEGQRWALPAQVFARPLELYPGLARATPDIERELQALGYRPVRTPRQPGTYRLTEQRLTLVSRPFRFWDGDEPSQHAVVRFNAAGVTAVEDPQRRALGLVRLDPAVIGGLYPDRQREDRVLVQLSETPAFLIRALIVVEDRDFYTHHGVSLKAVLRAAWANLRARAVVQGGSTLTQQLVKNLFLSDERALRRKINEALMAGVLEYRYEKADILQAYLNEVYLGQAGHGAIHGFAQGSRFYFRRPLAELSPAQLALLVGLVKGPSYYNPRRHPERARQRRNLVLSMMARHGALTAAQARAWQAEPLGVTARPPSGRSPYPAYLDLVRRQLREDYREDDLTTEGLRVFTNLDPIVQFHADRAVANRIRYLERRLNHPQGELQGAAVVSRADSGEVTAVVGGRDPAYAGFNRALDARRPVGSLLKPAVYLTALAQGGRYTLATPVDDGPLAAPNPGRDAGPWRPMNADKRHHGVVLLRNALIHSYNVATVRLGLALGVDEVLDTLYRLGIERRMQPYPSLFLGAQGWSPLEVAQVYQTLAAGGFRTPLKAIREVQTAYGEPLQRDGLALRQMVDPGPVYLLTDTLAAAVREGTARFLPQMLPAGLRVAGKTGTTDDLRDSWFAGYTADTLAVAWVGMDDNSPAGLSGAGGAMLIFGDIIKRLAPRSLEPMPPSNVRRVWIHPASGLLATPQCPGALQLPFLVGTEPTLADPCAVGLGATRRSRRTVAPDSANDQQWRIHDEDAR